MIKRLNGLLDMKKKAETSFAGRATMGQIGIIRGQNVSAVAVFHWLPKMIASDELVHWKALIVIIGKSRRFKHFRVLADRMSVRKQKAVYSPNVNATNANRAQVAIIRLLEQFKVKGIFLYIPKNNMQIACQKE